MNKKIISLMLFAAIIGFGFYQKDLLLAWIQAGGSLSIMVSILFIAILAFFPVVPFVFAAGVIGAVFGTWTGSLITLTGAILGALLMFALARFGFRDWAQQTLQKYPKAKEYETYFEKSAFASILLVRVIPVIPSPVVNILCGVSQVSWGTYFLASAIGKIPSNLVFNLAGSSLGQNKLFSIALYGVYFTVITALAYVYMRKQEMKKE